VKLVTFNLRNKSFYLKLNSKNSLTKVSSTINDTHRTGDETRINSSIINKRIPPPERCKSSNSGTKEFDIYVNSLLNEFKVLETHEKHIIKMYNQLNDKYKKKLQELNVKKNLFITMQKKNDNLFEKISFLLSNLV
jgi:hypothetical protein